MAASFVSRSARLCAIVLLLLLGCVASSAAETINVGALASASYSPLLDGCSIHADWNATVEYRSSRNLYAVLPAPYCQWVSSAYDDDNHYVIYALDARTGVEAWRWTCNSTEARCDLALDDEGAVVRSTTTPGRLYIATTTGVTPQYGLCDTLHALDAATGKVLWSDTICNQDKGGFYSPAVLTFPLAGLGGKDEYVVHILDPASSSKAVVHVLAGSDGRLAWSGNITAARWNGRLPLNHGVEGLFTLVDLTSSGGVQYENVYRVNVNGSIELVAADSQPFSSANYNSLRLSSSPAVLYNRGTDAFLEAIDVVTGAQVWNSTDPFLVGDSWGVNDTFTHLSTDYNTLASSPQLFLVINTAAGSIDNSSVVISQLALYNLSTGLRYSISPLFTLTNLTHPTDNPTTWDLVDDDVLAVRADSQWYMLDLPSLTVRAHGHYALADQGFVSNEWLVDADGSYIAVPYGSQSLVQGFAPRQDKHAVDTFLVSPPDAPTGSSGVELSTTTMVILVMAALILLVAVIVAATMLWSRRSGAVAKAANQERLLAVGAQVA